MNSWIKRILCLAVMIIAFSLDFMPSQASQAAPEEEKKSSPAAVQKAENVLVLPASLQMIGEDAFGGSAAEAVLLPTGLETVEKKAFADMAELKSVYIPETVTEIDRQAFSGAGKPVLIGQTGSLAESWARENRYDFSGTWVLRFRLRAGKAEHRAPAEPSAHFASREKQKETIQPEKRKETSGRLAENRVMKKEYRSELNHLVGLFP